MAAVKEYCSFEGFMKGIKFYGGFAGIHAMMDVRLTLEPSNQYDRNAVLVSRRGTIVGHLDFETAGAIAPLMDMNIPSFVIKA